jgi:hypothetical protein
MWGGLGNQFFIYAFGKYMSRIYAQNVKYDFTWFGKNHSYDHDINYLDDFDTDYEIADQEDLNRVRPPEILERDIVSFLARKAPMLKPVIAATTGMIYETPLSQMNKTIPGPYQSLTHEFDLKRHRDHYMVGYWQSHEYADEHRQELCSELSPRNISERTKEIVARFDSGEYVSVHFRKTDSGEGGNTEFPWYRRALRHLLDEYPEATFVVFSNDIPWVTDHIQLPDSTIFFDHTDHRSAAEDIYAMSRCSHNIIAASTFSWWGAYLNENPGKTVIAPRCWGDIDISTTDKCPESWVLI